MHACGVTSGLERGSVEEGRVARASADGEGEGEGEGEGDLTVVVIGTYYWTRRRRQCCLVLQVLQNVRMHGTVERKK
jgi:hypothetical protein